MIVVWHHLIENVSKVISFRNEIMIEAISHLLKPLERGYEKLHKVLSPLFSHYPA
jgi:hypothetical protein